jgi:type I restriction enzyme M protein
MKLLKVGGRCISVVPEGVLTTDNEKAYINLRQELVEKQKLIAVISMPNGIFQPYSGVKTSYILFQKTNRGGTDKVWFYEMKADGYTLDKKRQPINDNDLPDIVSRFNNLVSENTRKKIEQSFFVTIEEIRQKNYDLSFNKHKEVVREEKVYRKTSEILDEIDNNQREINKNIIELKKYLD